MAIFNPAQNLSKVRYPSGVVTFFSEGTIFGGNTAPAPSGDQFSAISAKRNEGDLLILLGKKELTFNVDLSTTFYV